MDVEASTASNDFASRELGRRRGPTRLSVYQRGTATLDEVLAAALATGGVVLPGNRGLATARRLVRDRGFTGELRLDAIRYQRRSEDLPAHRQQSLLDEWSINQQDLRVTELMTAPEAVIADGDIGALARELNDDEWPAESRVVLPLDAAWLSNHTDKLAREIGRAARPVAVGLRAAFDPLHSLPRVQGLAALAAPGLDVMLLRSDVSALGGLALGMRRAAIGVSTYTRHVPGVIKTADTDKPEAPRGTDVFIPALGAHHRAVTLQMMEAVGSAALHGLDICWCAHCAGRSLTRFAYHLDPEAGRDHDLAAILDLASAVSGNVG